MADIYLTKIERKTIFTRALIYVLILFVVADLTVTGPFFVNFVPLLYVLSILISIRGVDKVLTGIIGTFTVFMASTITNGFNLTTLLYTLNAIVQLGMGMLSAYIIHKFVLDHRLVEYIKPKKKIILSIFLVLFTLLSLVISSAVHGDIITYLKSKSNLKEYVSKVYDVEYEIKQVIYNRKLPGKYSYVVDVSGEQVYFVPVLDIAFKDVNQNERLELKNKDINDNLSKNIGTILQEVEILTKEDIILKYSYTSYGVVPDSLSANINMNSVEDEKTYEQIANVIKKMFEMYPNITEFNIELNNKNLHILKKDISLVNSLYIKDGFNIENLDK